MALFGGLFGDKGQKAQVVNGVQKITVTVDGGYQPETIQLEKGIPAEITFDRKDPSGCLAQVKFKAFDILEDLPLGEKTLIRFTPEQSGKFDYSCGMEMIYGHYTVK